MNRAAMQLAVLVDMFEREIGGALVNAGRYDIATEINRLVNAAEFPELDPRITHADGTPCARERCAFRRDGGHTVRVDLGDAEPIRITAYIDREEPRTFPNDNPHSSQGMRAD